MPYVETMSVHPSLSLYSRIIDYFVHQVFMKFSRGDREQNFMGQV